MKKLSILTVLLIAACNAMAQPTLTASNSDPVIGDVFYQATCKDTTLAFASGAGVTWDYSGLTITKRDTTVVLNCMSTPKCDTFPTSTMVEFTRHDSFYVYLQPVAGRLSWIGEYVTATCCIAEDYVHFTKPLRFVNYPTSYGGTWLDTVEYHYGTAPYVDEIRFDRSCTANGYGTLKTPLGVYSNVVLVKNLCYLTEKHFGYVPVDIEYDTVEQYMWYKPNSHYPLAIIEKYLTKPETYRIRFTNTRSALAAPETMDAKDEFVLSPNPAGDYVKISNSAGGMKEAVITISDMSGRTVMDGMQIQAQGDNERTIPVRGLAPGLYLVHIQLATGVVVKKIVVGRD